MIHKNEIYPNFRIIPCIDAYEHDENLLNEALNGLQSCEGCKIDDSLHVKVRMYKEMIQQAGYDIVTDSTLGDYATIWYLDDLLKSYEEHYPDRYTIKEQYSRMEVNNMLFDLSLKNVLRGYSQVIIPYSIAMDYNNESFSEHESIHVQII